MLVDRAEARGGIEGHAGAVAVLVHAAHAGMDSDQLLGDHVARAELDHQMAATAAAGARGKVRRRQGYGGLVQTLRVRRVR